MALLYIEKVNDNQAQFEQEVIRIGKKLAIPPDALMFVMNIETGGTFSPSIQNTTYPVQGGYATGLIQFTPNTATSLGTSTDALKMMSNIEQLQYVEKYFAPYAGRVNNIADVYLIVFFPAALGWSDDRILQTSTLSAQSVANSNPAFDLDKNGQITVEEFRQWVNSKLPVGYRYSIEMQPTVIDKAIAYTRQPTNWWKIGIVIIGLLALYFIGKQIFLKK